MLGLFAQESRFCLGVRENFTLNLPDLLIWAYPEILSQIGHGWVFLFMGWGVSPIFAIKIWFCLRVGNIHFNSFSFIDLSLSWNLDPNWTWLCFFVDLGIPPPFLPKFRFFGEELKNFHLQLWLFIGLDTFWKFMPRRT